MTLILDENKKITLSIFSIRGQKVMLDSDLAHLFQVETSHLNKAVKRNLVKFPESFMFQLTKEEFNLIFQNGMSRWACRKTLSSRISSEKNRSLLSINEDFLSEY